MSEVVRKATGTLARVVVFRLAPGSDLLDGIRDAARNENIRTGVILSAAAFLQKAALRNVRELPRNFPITDEVRFVSNHDGPIEVVSLTGNVSERDGETFVHAHIAVSLGHRDGVVYGGHAVRGNIVFSTAEIVLAEIHGISMCREYDPLTKSIELSV